jgi:predicted nucleotidyltransferase
MKTVLPEKSKIISTIIYKLKEVVSRHFGKRLQQVILYGSYARGNFNENSDIDLLIVLEEIKSEIQEIETLAELKTDIQLESDIYISTNPVSFDKFQNSEFQFYKNIRKEGIIL